jgi:hypothetical protein
MSHTARTVAREVLLLAGLVGGLVAVTSAAGLPRSPATLRTGEAAARAPTRILEVSRRQPVQRWTPARLTTWQWQLTGLPVDETVDAAMYDIDLFDTAASVVTGLHARGRKVVCYMSAGSWEDWRPDAARFPPSVRGAPLTGWPGERWLDIRRLDMLGPLMEARMDLCKQKGFDAIEPDNVDGYANRSGFPLTAADQLRYNTWLSAAAHARGLSIGLKNDLDQVESLVTHFDWALVEQCFEYDECHLLAPFTKAGKAVFAVEYSLPTAEFCGRARALGFNAMRKNLKLDAYRAACP